MTYALYYMPFFCDVNKTSHLAAASMIGRRHFKTFYWAFQYEKGIGILELYNQCCFKT